MSSEPSEAVVKYLDPDGAVRSLRGSFSTDGPFLVVGRRSGIVRIPISRVLIVEVWGPNAEGTP